MDRTTDIAPLSVTRAMDFAFSMRRLFRPSEICKITNASDVGMELTVLSGDGFSRTMTIPPNGNKDINRDVYDLFSNKIQRFCVRPALSEANVEGTKQFYFQHLKSNDKIEIKCTGPPDHPVAELHYTHRKERGKIGVSSPSEICKITNSSQVPVKLTVKGHCDDGAYVTIKEIPISPNAGEEIDCRHYDCLDENPGMRLIFHVVPRRSAPYVEGKKEFSFQDLKSNEEITINCTGPPDRLVAELQRTPRAERIKGGISLVSGLVSDLLAPRETCKITNASDVHVKLTVTRDYGPGASFPNEEITISPNAAEEIDCKQYDCRDTNPWVRLIFDVVPMIFVTHVEEKCFHFPDLENNDGIRITYTASPDPSVVELHYIPKGQLSESPTIQDRS